MAKKELTCSFTMDGKPYDPSMEATEVKNKRNMESMKLAGFRVTVPAKQPVSS